MNHTEFQYINLCKNILDEPIGEDRTGIGTKSLFGKQLRFDLSEGFPLLTTKKVNHKVVFSELLWFISGSSNERDLCQLVNNTKSKDKKTIWTPNTKDRADSNPERFNGYNMGNMYNIAWRYSLCNPHGYVRLPRRKYKDDFTESHITPEMDIVYDEPRVIESSKSGNFSVIGKKDGLYVIKFHDTGSYRTTKTITKTVKDLFKPSVEGVGYSGGVIQKDNITSNLYRLWQDMLIRVYNPRKNHSSYENVSVCKRWLNFYNFKFDVYSILGFQEYVDSGYTWQLDKDYWGSNIYSPDTCMFISPEMNKSLNGGGEGFKIYEFENQYFYSRTSLQKYRGLTRKATLPENLNILTDDETHVVRPIIYIDQLSNVIDTIKNNPTSRRIIIDAWNKRDIGNAVLGVCHPFVQFYVRNGKLSCHLYQRSVDVFLGLPFNIASYALLTHMLAQICGYEVGELVWTGGDCHIYKNHIEQVKTQVKRWDDGEFHLMPTIELNKDITDIDDFTLEDIKLIDYVSEPKITGKIAV